jgi:phosphate starvation-inducible PhoH-like protein
MAKRNVQKVIEERWTKKEEKGRQVNEKFQGEVRPPVQAKTPIQKEFLAALREYDVVVFSAPAGCGKSFLTMSEASDWLKKGYYDKITLSRAVIPMGRSLGMLPSTLQQKFEPYLMPLLEVLWNRYGKNYYENCLHDGTIELLAPEYARGRSVSGIMIIDEVQSMMPDELYTMLTRVEEGAKLILIGDPNQSDIKGTNGIEWLEGFVNKNPELQSFIKVIKATSDDIVRSGLCKSMVKAKEKESK